MNSLPSGMLTTVGFIMALIWTLLGPAMLRMSVSIVNALASDESSSGIVPPPTWGRAVRIIFVIMLIYLFTGLTIVAVAPDGTILPNRTAPRGYFHQGKYVFQPPAPPPKPSTFGSLEKFGVYGAVIFLITASLFAAMLPTSLVRAIAVTFCFALISFIPFALLTGAMMAVSMALK